MTSPTLIKKPTLKKGDRGAAVVELQSLLAHWGSYRGAKNGSFDTAVEEAVKRFQYRCFLVDDGIVGSLTWKALFTGSPVNMPVLKRGSRGQDVFTVQQVLCISGHYQAVHTGEFDPATENAVKAFQSSFILVADGIVGPQTWNALSKIPRTYPPVGRGCYSNPI